MTLADAARQDISRIRLPIWAVPTAYVKLSLSEGRYAWWALLFERRTQEAIGEFTPQQLAIVFWDSPDWEPYTGALDPADTP
jgi:hypothetical protein